MKRHGSSRSARHIAFTGLGLVLMALSLLVAFAAPSSQTAAASGEGDCYGPGQGTRSPLIDPDRIRLEPSDTAKVRVRIINDFNCAEQPVDDLSLCPLTDRAGRENLDFRRKCRSIEPLDLGETSKRKVRVGARRDAAEGRYKLRLELRRASTGETSRRAVRIRIGGTDA